MTVIVGTSPSAMTLHMIKLSAGCDAVETLEAWQAERRARFGRVFHRTRMMPRRREELLSGGSIYWVIRGLIQVRQEFVGIEPFVDEAGDRATLLLLDPELRRTSPTPRRAFQGWRYLPAADAPPDLDSAAAGQPEMPVEMLAELRTLGLL